MYCQLGLLFVVAAQLLKAETISIGGVQIEISNPEGFVRVTPKMEAVARLQAQMVAANNEEFAAFIAEAGREAALGGGLPDLTRRFVIQSSKRIVSASVKASDFNELKRVIKTQNTEIFKKVEAQIPGIADKISRGLSKAFDAKVALSVGQVMPLPPHEETGRSLAYSMLVPVTTEGPDGKPSTDVVVMTSTLVHVRGKVLFLYSYAEEGGLRWSRETSKAWANAILSANPAEIASGGLPAGVAGGLGGVVGAMVVGVLARRRRRAKAA